MTHRWNNVINTSIIANILNISINITMVLSNMRRMSTSNHRCFPLFLDELGGPMALFVMEPPKSLGPPTVVLVQQTSDNPVGAPESLDKFGICFSYLSQERFTCHADITSIGVTRMQKQLH
jgi:hypothetical protein